MPLFSQLITDSGDPSRGRMVSNDPVCAGQDWSLHLEAKDPPRVSPHFLLLCSMQSPYPCHILLNPNTPREKISLCGYLSCCPSLYQAQDFCLRKQAALSAPRKFFLSSCFNPSCAVRYQTVHRNCGALSQPSPSPLLLQLPYGMSQILGVRSQASEGPSGPEGQPRCPGV